MKAFFKALCILVALQGCLINVYAGELIKWKYKIEGSIYTSPVIKDQTIYFGGMNKKFYAINQESGTKIWEYATENEITSNAVLNDSLVIFESGYKLFALNRKSGKQVWSFRASDEKVTMSLGTTDYHHSSPVIYGDLVYFGDGWGNMNGVDIKTGALNFQYTVTGDSCAIRGAAAIQNDTIFFGTWAGQVFAVSLKDKSLLWKYSLKNRRPYYGMVTSDMVIHDTLLYFGSQHDVFSPLSLKTGKPAWTFIDPGQTYLPSTPVFYKNSVIIGSTINTFKIYSFIDGKINWSYPTDGIFFITPAIVDSIIIMNTSNFGGNGTMFMINGNNGKLVQEFHFSNAAPASPVVDGDNLYVGNGDGTLYNFNLKELLNPKDDTSIMMDTTTQFFNFKKSDAKQSIPFKIENIGNACDSFYLSYEITGSPVEKGIVVPAKKKGHLALGTKSTLFYCSVVPNLLIQGKYEITFQLKSKRHPEMLFNKKFQIEIQESNHVVNKTTGSVKVYPNPADNIVSFSFENLSESTAKLDIYALNGKLVYSYSGQPADGNIIWNTVDLAGKTCKAGTYVYRLVAGNANSSGAICLTGRNAK